MILKLVLIGDNIIWFHDTSEKLQISFLNSGKIFSLESLLPVAALIPPAYSDKSVHI